MRPTFLARIAIAATLLPLLTTSAAWAWGRDGHMMINQLAAQYLPTSVPSFLRDQNGIDVIEWLGPEPDRWKQYGAEPELDVTQSPDHFLDYEWAIYGATPCVNGTPDCIDGYDFPRRRYDFIRNMTAAMPHHPEIKTFESVGFQPWQVEEVWQRLTIDFGLYRSLSAAHKDTAPVQVAILYDAGWLGHYVGDGSQPLHDTIEYNGWVGPNPHHYTTSHKIHALFETIYVSANIKASDVAPLVAAAQPTLINDEWTQYWHYLHRSHSLVDRVYQLDQQGGFDGAGTPEAKSFTVHRLAAGAIELRNLIYTAWIHSTDSVRPYNGPQ